MLTAPRAARITASALSLVVVLVGAVRAQTRAFVIPNHPNVTTSSWDYDVLLGAAGREMPVHVQYLYSTLDLPAGAWLLREVAYRRTNWHYMSTIPASTSQLSLTMSHGTRAPSETSPAFALNAGPDATMVFNGAVNWPPAPHSGPAPAPFAFPIKLSTPFQVVSARGKSLVLDYAITSRPAIVVWLDAAGRGDPLMDSLGGNLSCLASTGRPISGVNWKGGLVNTGGKWSLGFSPAPANVVGFAFFSGFGMDHTGPWPLPIDLAAYRALGCWWHIGLELGLHVPIDSWGTANLLIPPGLGGQRLYAQALFRDPSANPLGWVATTAAGFVVGTGIAANAAAVSVLNDVSNSPTGYVWQSFAPILEGRY